MNLLVYPIFCIYLISNKHETLDKKDYTLEALALLGIGISVIPVKRDGSKLPLLKWKEFQSRLMTEQEVKKYFTDCGGVIAITGGISKLICIDFDLDKELPTDNYWGRFMEGLPKELKRKMFINKTRSGGYHIWLRTDYEDKSRKVTHRTLTIPELYERYETMLSIGANEETASKMLLKKPLECIIETRSRGSYGVFVHKQYKRYYGTKIQEFTKEEVEILLERAYSLDCGYRKPNVFTGTTKEYSALKNFNENIRAEDVTKLLEESGAFSLYDIDINGNYRLARVGSNSLFSAYVYKDTGVLHVFGLNPLIEEDKQTMSPFEVYCSVKGISEKVALEKFK